MSYQVKFISKKLKSGALDTANSGWAVLNDKGEEVNEKRHKDKKDADEHLELLIAFGYAT